MSTQTSALTERWYDEVWNYANDSYIEEGMHRDCIIHGLDPSGSSQGVAPFKTFYANFRKSFPEIQIKLTHLISNEDTATVHCAVNAKNADGVDVNFTGISVARYRDGKIVEGWNSFDFLKMYQQLGHILVSQIK